VTAISTETPLSRTTTGSPPERFTSTDPEAFGVPTGREEDWRFTPMRPLRPLFQPFEPDNSFGFETELPDGVSMRFVGRDHPSVGTALTPADRVSALAAAHTPGVVLVTIAAGTELAEPVVLRSIGKPGLNYGHFVIEAGERSRATVVMDHLGSVTVAANVETVLADGAELTLISVQDWDPEAIHLAAHAALVGRDATYQHIVVNLGGKLVRLNPTVRFAGPGGTARLYGVSFCGDGQHQESRLYVDHGQPHCTSDVVYKSVLDGDTARTVWIGDVRIRPAAIGTSTYELNRNLLLSDGARADSVPNLEIETGEIVGAGHASATGRFDDLQLFYLQSRGIPAEEARRLVVRGFLADVIERVGVPELRDRLMTRVDTRLGVRADAPEVGA
jgi:Fe-S cluster assembly protein SufD